MSDAAAFIAKIVENPFDDTPRLVFADWLDENGDPERAEFIRLQIEQAELGECRGFRGRRWPHRGGRCCLSGCRYCLIAERLEALRGKAEPGWIYPNIDRWFYQGSLTHGKILTTGVTRGFVSAVQCDLADWVGGETLEYIARRNIGSGRFVTTAEVETRSKVTPAHGPLIVAEHPVELVEVADQQPYPGALRSNRDRHAWFHTRAPAGDEERRQKLPEFVFAGIDGFDNQGEPSAPATMVKWFNSIDEANAALRRFLLNWARREAGLPPLPAPSRDLGRVALV